MTNEFIRHFFTTTSHIRGRYGSVRLSATLFLALAFALASSGLRAQNVRISSANSSNNSVYDVDFASGSVLQINNDASTRSSIRSLVFFSNDGGGTGAPSVDLIVADTLRDELLRYPAPSPFAPAAGVSIWTPSLGTAGPNPSRLAGPVAANGLSLDPDQNLFTLSSTNGANSPATVWVLPKLASGSAAIFGLPLLVDSDFGPALTIDEIEESLVSRVATGSIGVGDLIVVASTPRMVLRYSAASIASVLAGNGEIDPVVVLPPTAFPDAAPVGIAIWPADNSLLVTTSGGTILKFTPFAGGFSPGTVFASGLGNGQFKIKTAVNFGEPRAYVANRNGGEIFELGPPPAIGPNLPLRMVTTGVENPQGLAVTNVAAANAADCVTSGCDALGGVLTHLITETQNSTIAGSLLQSPCTVAEDPRLGPGTPGGATCAIGETLDLSTICPEFESVTIPSHLCGTPSLAVVQTFAPGIIQVDGLFFSEAFAETILPQPDATIPPCPQMALSWVPVPGLETPSVAGNVFDELTSGCGSSQSLGRGGSYFLLAGLSLDGLAGSSDREKLRQFILGKYDLLLATLAGASIQRQFARTLERCIVSSRRDFERNRLDRDSAAALALIDCDNIAVANAGAFTASSTNPNPYGDVRGRLANLYLTIWSRLLGNAAPGSWPPGP